LNSNYADATVYIDRQLMNNRFNKQIKLSSGLHEVVVEKPGYRCWNQSFDLKKSEKVKLYAVLTPKKIIKLKNIKPVLTENNIVKTKPIQSQPPLKSSSLVKKVELTPKPTIKQKKINKIAPIMKAPSNLMVGKTWTENKTNMEFMGVPGGCFQMGSVDGISNEKPVHEVCVDDFFMGKFEVTQKQWNLVMGNNPADFQSWVQKTDDYPVESVSWEDVQSYVSKLNQMTGHVFRLPSEAEWEFACRGKSHQDIFSGGNSSVTVDEIANICDKKCQYEWRSKQHDDGYEKISPVGLKKPNSYGLYDMSGNVWEWIEDGYDELAYEKHLNKNPLITGGKKKVGRGGSWVVHYQLSRCAARRDGEKNKKANDLGFRLIKLN
jgi:formylglycine-generating enzyme required for sulfatase activity